MQRLNRIAANQRQLGRRIRMGVGGWIQSGHPHPHPHRIITTRFLDFYQLGNKEAIQKERARLTDEMNRGYFADIKELKQHGGKIAIANKTLVPDTTAIKFPDFEANYLDGRAVKLPIRSSGNADLAAAKDCPRVSLMCVSFRASSQPMIKSWSVPFLDAFCDAKHIHLYEVSFIDAWYLRLSPIKRLLLWTMKKPMKESFTLERQMIYSFGDHYYFRKELKILNLLSGYIFLLDKFGRIRWQGSGLASQEELSSLLSCTSSLLKEN